jgi:HSP20 family molecular chaperone IbpA
MKNLLVPAAIAISGLFMVNHLENANSVHGVCSSNDKHDHASYHRHFRNQELTASEVPVNAVKVVSFASITETIMPSFFIDFSDKQTTVSDIEINNQMEQNLVEISLPGTDEADLEINSRMEESLVSISLPKTEIADLEMIENFTAK